MKSSFQIPSPFLSPLQGSTHQAPERGVVCGHPGGLFVSRARSRREWRGKRRPGGLQGMMRVRTKKKNMLLPLLSSLHGPTHQAPERGVVCGHLGWGVEGVEGWTLSRLHLLGFFFSLSPPSFPPPAPGGMLAVLIFSECGEPAAGCIGPASR